MKHFIALFVFLIPFPVLSQTNDGAGSTGQIFALSAHLAIQKPMKKEIEFNNRIIGHTNDIGFGFRAEANLLLREREFRRGGGFFGIGFGAFGPVEDSATMSPNLINGPTIHMLGTQKTSMMTYGLRFGYEIPLKINDFLMIYAGGGLQLARVKQTLVFPEAHDGFYYTQDDFEQDEFEPTIESNACFEVLVGGFYELEKFHLSAHYSFFYPVAGARDKDVGRHGLNLGVLYPIRRHNS